jgi:hypothetical protein
MKTAPLGILQVPAVPWYYPRHFTAACMGPDLAFFSSPPKKRGPTTPQIGRIEVSQSLSQQPVGGWKRIMAQSTALDHPLIPVYTLSLVSPLFDRRFSSLWPLVDDANRQYRGRLVRISATGGRMGTNSASFDGA